MGQAEAALKKYHTVEFSLDRTTDFIAVGKRKRFTDRVSVAFVNPGKLRMESHGQLLNQLVVSDGGNTSIFDFKAKAYWTLPAAMDLTSSVASLGFPARPGAALLSASPQTLGEEVLTIDGQRHDCWIVQDSGTGEFSVNGALSLREPVWTLWLDKKLGIDLQSTFSAALLVGAVQGRMEVKTVKKSLKLNADVAESRFTFPSPYRAKAGAAADLAEADFFIEPNMTGKLDSVVLTREGRDKPTELLGHPVLLAYAPTWCQPCRQSMAVLGKLYREHKDQGLIVVQYFVGEERIALEQFLAKSPVEYEAVDQADAFADLKVSGYPTFIMFDKDGEIVAMIYGNHVTVDVIQINLTTSTLRVKARKAIFPRVGIAQEVYTKIMNQLE